MASVFRWHSPGIGRRLLQRAAVRAVVTIAILEVLVAPSGRIHAALLGALLGPVVVAVEAAWSWLVLPLEAKRRCKQQPDLLQPRSYRALPEGLEYEERGDRVLIRWHGFLEMLGADRHLFFVIDAGTALVVARAAFPTPAASQQFLNYCEECAQDSVASPTLAAGPVEKVTLGPQSVEVRFVLSEPERSLLARAGAWRRVHERFRALNHHPENLAFGLLGVVIVIAVLRQFTGWVGVGMGTLAALAAASYGARQWALRQLQGYAQATGEQEVRISPLGLWLVSQGRSDLYVPWRAVRAVRRSRGFVLVQADDGLAFGLPERAFPDGSALVAFVERAHGWQQEQRA